MIYPNGQKKIIWAKTLHFSYYRYITENQIFVSQNYIDKTEDFIYWTEFDFFSKFHMNLQLSQCTDTSPSNRTWSIHQSDSNN